MLIPRDPRGIVWILHPAPLFVFIFDLDLLGRRTVSSVEKAHDTPRNAGRTRAFHAR